MPRKDEVGYATGCPVCGQDRDFHTLKELREWEREINKQFRLIAKLRGYVRPRKHKRILPKGGK